MWAWAGHHAWDMRGDDSPGVHPQMGGRAQDGDGQNTPRPFLPSVLAHGFHRRADWRCLWLAGVLIE